MGAVAHPQVASAIEEARKACRDRRKRVLAHDDIAQLLTQQPIGYKQPQQWNGFIPPELWRERHNDSPRRAALVKIMNLVDAREYDQRKGAS